MTHKHKRRNGVTFACDCDEFDALAARLAKVEHERDALRGVAQEMIDCYHESGGMPNWKYFIRQFQLLVATVSADGRETVSHD